MPKPRYAQISTAATPYYHCVSRCVRRAFLCGTDTLTGQSYEHRRQWVETRLLALSEVFALDICAYAVMSNHYHVVLHINEQQAWQWSMDEVIERWHSLFKGNALSQRYARGEPLGSAELLALKGLVKLWRQRLVSISWFMRILNESIAREANKEDHCTGRFWEGRFKSQALLDEAALIACMAYVDLNPVRANIANTPQTSDHTSIKTRINQHDNTHLFPFIGNSQKHMPEGLPFDLIDYIKLVDWTGRLIRDDKRGAISENTPLILDRLKQEPDNWLFLCENFERKLKGLVGSADKLSVACTLLGYQRVQYLSQCLHYFT